MIGILTGPTATGKTSLAIELALKQGNIEIVNADSILVYRGFDIGAAKPSSQEREKVPHHLIDVRNADEVFTAGEFKRSAEMAIQDIHARGKRALIVGGTGFYLKALLFGLWQAPAADLEVRKKLEQNTNEELFTQLGIKDPVSASRIHSNDRYRLIRALELIALTGKAPSQFQTEVSQKPDPRFQLWIIDRTNDELHERIRMRTQELVERGIVDEFRTIQQSYSESRALSSVGYAQVSHFINGQSPLGRKIKPGPDGLRDEIELATRQLVKRQRTYFRNLFQQLNSNPTPAPPSAQWFNLEQDRSMLEVAFKSLYDSEQ